MENKIEKFLLNIVDVAWNECTESTEVPSTEFAKSIINKANEDNITLFIDEDKKAICKWKTVDDGYMGFHDYEYHTTCKKRYSCDEIIKENYCPNCGGKIE